MIMNVSAKNVKRAIFSILAEITTSQFTYYKLKSLPATVSTITKIKQYTAQAF